MKPGWSTPQRPYSPRPYGLLRMGPVEGEVCVPGGVVARGFVQVVGDYVHVAVARVVRVGAVPGEVRRPESLRVPHHFCIRVDGQVVVGPHMWKAERVEACVDLRTRTTVH